MFTLKRNLLLLAILSCMASNTFTSEQDDNLQADLEQIGNIQFFDQENPEEPIIQLGGQALELLEQEADATQVAIPVEEETREDKIKRIKKGLRDFRDEIVFLIKFIDSAIKKIKDDGRIEFHTSEVGKHLHDKKTKAKLSVTIIKLFDVFESNGLMTMPPICIKGLQSIKASLRNLCPTDGTLTKVLNGDLKALDEFEKTAQPFLKGIQEHLSSKHSITNNIIEKTQNLRYSDLWKLSGAAQAAIYLMPIFILIGVTLDYTVTRKLENYEYFFSEILCNVNEIILLAILIPFYISSKAVACYLTAPINGAQFIQENSPGFRPRIQFYIMEAVYGSLRNDIGNPRRIENNPVENAVARISNDTERIISLTPEIITFMLAFFIVYNHGIDIENLNATFIQLTRFIMSATIITTLIQCVRKAINPESTLLNTAGEMAFPEQFNEAWQENVDSWIPHNDGLAFHAIKGATVIALESLKGSVYGYTKIFTNLLSGLRPNTYNLKEFKKLVKELLKDDNFDLAKETSLENIKDILEIAQITHKELLEENKEFIEQGYFGKLKNLNAQATCNQIVPTSRMEILIFRPDFLLASTQDGLDPELCDFNNFFKTNVDESDRRNIISIIAKIKELKKIRKKQN